ncbi:MAG: hypothetical protein KAR20_23035 [Candidatus Heimdallarchaeota archaeon]|nr:hypothetical protein [Candidatus Heimdallarchaeota archaeon]
MPEQNYSKSWLIDEYVFTATTRDIPLKGNTSRLVVIGRFKLLPEDEDGFCSICQSQKVFGDQIFALGNRLDTANDQTKNIFLPLEFCAGEFLRVKNSISSSLQELLSASDHNTRISGEQIDSVLKKLTLDDVTNIDLELVQAFQDEVPLSQKRHSLFCDHACNLPQDLFQALVRNINEKGTRGYYIQKGHSELFARINQYWPTFGIFWPSEVGAVGTAKTADNEIVLNLQLMEIRYSLQKK